MVTLPDKDAELKWEERDGERVYFFPAKSTLRHEAIDRWRLALVISQAVAAICLWAGWPALAQQMEHVDWKDSCFTI